MTDDFRPQNPPQPAADTATPDVDAPNAAPNTDVKETDDAVVAAVRGKLQANLKDKMPKSGGRGDAYKDLGRQMISRLPAGLQEKLDENFPELQKTVLEAARGAGEFLGPLWVEARSIGAAVARQVVASRGVVASTVGGTFRHVCVVGLNRSELLLGGETEPVFNDSWSDLAGDNIKRHTALLFFAPRGLDGKPVNPYLFLMGEGIPDEEDMVDQNAANMAEQQVGPMALVDLCRMSKSEPNTVNMLLAADTLFHWDVKDNYVLPTTPTGWVRDVENVLKSYPRTTRAHLYTQWDASLLPPTDRITVHTLRDMPLDDATWLNKPTLQERYGNHALLAGIAIAALTWAGLWMQGRQLDTLADQLSIIEQQIPRGGDFSSLDRAIGEQEKMWRKRNLFPLVVKDTARAIERSGLQVDQLEVRVAEPDNAPKTYVVSIDVKDGVYSGWLQQEPIARALVLNSALLDAIRKPSTTRGFKLEGLVDAGDLEKAYKPFASRVDKAALDNGAKAATGQPATAPAMPAVPVGGGVNREIGSRALANGSASNGAGNGASNGEASQ